MSQSAAVRNPFLLLLNPEIVLAAIEKSEHLGQLTRHLCRPLDRPSQACAANAESPDAESPDADDGIEGLETN